MNGRYKRLWVLPIAIFLAVALTAVVPGCFGGEPGVDDLWRDSQNADANITSLHMDVTISYQNTNYGSGQIQTTSIDVSGDNIHAQTVLFGQSFSDVIRVGGKQYSKVIGSDQWNEEAVTLSMQSVTNQIESLANLPSLSSSSQNLGLESVNGVQAYHLSFVVPPQNVTTIFPNVPASQLSSSAGANVDVWIEQDTNYKVKYQATIMNVLITDHIGYGDVQVVTNITDINKPITINPPV